MAPYYFCSGLPRNFNFLHIALGPRIKTHDTVDDGVFYWGLSLTSEFALDLCRAVTPIEIKAVVFQISDNKAPGPDGYTSCFFKKAWNIMGNLVCRAIMDFFRSGQMLRQLNHTNYCPLLEKLISPRYIPLMSTYGKAFDLVSWTFLPSTHGDVSGLAVNTSKSCIFTAGIQDDILDGILATTEFARGNMPVRYLGIPLTTQRLSVTDYSPLVDQIVGYIGPSSGIPREHRWSGRKFAIRRKKAVWVFGISNPGTLLSLPEFYGTFIAKQTPYGLSGSMRSTSSLWDWQPKKGDSPLLRRVAEIRDRIITDFGSTDAAI
ncbi:UNVERIFIED_CONTAM: hypothetical protein Sangu_1597900 [Sesamum angustifolium]|uniref:Uncharacterized protein n=1 Tax=Sesamum angustifolium TaxID=2727405 RepID=A0AAW2MSV0_9LAMI